MRIYINGDIFFKNCVPRKIGNVIDRIDGVDANEWAMLGRDIVENKYPIQVSSHDVLKKFIEHCLRNNCLEVGDGRP